MNPHQQTPVFHPLWTRDLQANNQADIPWLWQGYLAPGMTTLLTSQWKSGKTTMAAALLARLKTGGQFAGLPLRAGKAVVLTEESSGHWFQRNRKLAFGDHLCWFCRPFVGRPRPQDWQALLGAVLDLHAQHRFDLVVVDPLLHFLPASSENTAPAMVDFLMTLQCLTAAGLAVWLQHHPRKGRLLDGQAARGSGALPSFVDILLEMRWYGRGDDGDRRRRIAAWSRFDDTPRRLVLELNSEATDYINHGDFALDDFLENWKHVRTILQDGDAKMTRKEILESWPADFPAPDKGTLWRWLQCAREKELVRVDGLGTRLFPYRYWLPEREKNELFAYFTGVERVGREYHQILNEMGYFAPFANVPTADRAQAQRLAAQRVYGDAPPPMCNLFGPDSAVEDDSAQPTSSPVLDGPAPFSTKVPCPTESTAPLPPEPPPPPPAPVPPRALPYPYNIMAPADVPQWVRKGVQP
jgi:hypothetical protein